MIQIYVISDLVFGDLGFHNNQCFTIHIYQSVSFLSSHWYLIWKALPPKTPSKSSCQTNKSLLIRLLPGKKKQSPRKKSAKKNASTSRQGQQGFSHFKHTLCNKLSDFDNKARQKLIFIFSRNRFFQRWTWNKKMEDIKSRKLRCLQTKQRLEDYIVFEVTPFEGTC